MFKLSVQQFFYKGMAALFVFAFVLGAAGVQVARAASLTVTNLDDSGPGSLRQAVADAQPGDTITFDPVLSGGTISLISTIDINKDLTILGPGADQLTISGNQTFAVFAIHSYESTYWSVSTVMIQGLAFRDFAPIIYVFTESMLTVNNSTFSNNSGGIGNLGGTLTVNNSVFNNNVNGIGNSGTATVNNSTFSNNSAVGNGAGIYNGGLLTVNNSTFSNNSADYGGGIYSDGLLTVNNSTFSNNSANYGGGIFNYYMLNLTNTLIVNSSSGGNCANYSVYGFYNVAGVNYSTDNTCPGLTQVTSAQLNLGALADNGGPTQTIALLPGSVAIDAALDCTDYNGNMIATDQRGVARPQGAACDVGAFELEQQAPFNFSGFFQPVDNLPTLNTVKAGQGVPVKFGLGGDQGLAVFAEGYPISQQVACASGLPVDDIEQTVTAGGSSLSYDLATQTYTYVWKTNSGWKGQCRTLLVRLSDGTEHLANFKFK
jgi:predicted outer membrane repeat protein